MRYQIRDAEWGIFYVIPTNKAYAFTEWYESVNLVDGCPETVPDYAEPIDLEWISFENWKRM